MTSTVNSIDFHFTVKVTDKNINMLRRLYGKIDMPSIEDEEDIEINEELDLCLSLEGELINESIIMAMLFNSNDVIGKPIIKVTRLEPKSNSKIDKKFQKIVKNFNNENV